MEIIKEVIVERSIDFESLQKMMLGLEKVEVSRTEKESKGETRTLRNDSKKKVTQKSKSVNKKEIKKDPLTKIEGIGPAIQKLLYADGILTFAQLSKASKNRLVEILEGGGSRFRMHNPSTWPQQSKLAAKGKWTELKSLQDKLDGGKK